MLKGSTVGLCFLILSTFSLGIWAADETFSPTTADAFYQTAVELYSNPDASGSQAAQAMVFFDAVSSLGPESRFILPDVIKCAWKYPAIDFSNQIKGMLTKYVDESADLEITRLAVQYVVDRLNTREEREYYFATMLKQINTRNKALSSEFATQLGLLSAERADVEAAEFYLMQAYNSNIYNRVAFEKLLEISSKPMPADLQMRHLRMMMNANPYDIEAAFAFAHKAYELGLYSIAANGFEYCADLFAYLHPKEPLPYVIYRPWAMSCYNDPRKLSTCINIAEKLKVQNQFDLVAEAIAGKAAIKTGDAMRGTEILVNAAQRAEEMQAGGNAAIKAQDLAWYYCFALPTPDKALAWANQANAADANSPGVTALLAYALAMNNQADVAGPLVSEIKNNQAALLTLGRIDDSNAAVDSLRAAIAMDEATLEAHEAMTMLDQKGASYVSQNDNTAIAKMLQSEFSEDVVNNFTSPEKLFTAKLSASGNEFTYGSMYTANMVLTNNSSDPIMIFDGGILQGNIRIDAKISGDVKEFIPKLVTMKVRPSAPIQPKQSYFVPVRLITGKLRNLLLSSPQAKIEVEFTAYMDPVEDANGTVRNSLASVKPMKLTVKQDPVKVSSSYIQSRLNSLGNGVHGQKLRSAQLFAGLLLENENTAPYKRVEIPAPLLRSALARCLQDEDWQLKVETTLLLSKLKLSYDIQEAISANLTDKSWPVRMTSLWILARNTGPEFGKVIDWTKKNDGNANVIQMAKAFSFAEAVAVEKAVEPKAVPAEANDDVKAEPAVMSTDANTAGTPELKAETAPAQADDSNAVTTEEVKAETQSATAPEVPATAEVSIEDANTTSVNTADANSAGSTQDKPESAGNEVKPEAAAEAKKAAEPNSADLLKLLE